MAQRIHEQIGFVAAVEPKRHLFEVGREMLRADFVPRSNDAALQKREGRLNGVRVNIPVNVNLLGVRDSLVLRSVNSSVNHGLRVGCEVIRDNYLYIAGNLGILQGLPNVLFYRFSAIMSLNGREEPCWICSRASNRGGGMFGRLRDGTPIGGTIGWGVASTLRRENGQCVNCGHITTARQALILETTKDRAIQRMRAAWNK